MFDDNGLIPDFFIDYATDKLFDICAVLGWLDWDLAKTRQKLYAIHPPTRNDELHPPLTIPDKISKTSQELATVTILALVQSIEKEVCYRWELNDQCKEGREFLYSRLSAGLKHRLQTFPYRRRLVERVENLPCETPQYSTGIS